MPFTRHTYEITFPDQSTEILDSTGFSATSGGLHVWFCERVTVFGPGQWQKLADITHIVPPPALDPVTRAHLEGFLVAQTARAQTQARRRPTKRDRDSD